VCSKFGAKVIKKAENGTKRSRFFVFLLLRQFT